MRRMVLTLAVLAAGALAACQPASTATISAKAAMAKPMCGSETDITGVVNPAGATPRVTLQRTVNGQWVDWKWKRGSSGGEIKLLSTAVQPDGSYRLRYTSPTTAGVTYHLRVRSEGGGAVSNGVYITPVEFPGYHFCD